MQIPLFHEDRERLERAKVYGTAEFRYAYHYYIRSREWLIRCQAVKKRANGKCERCFKKPCSTIHYLTNEWFMNEPLPDLQGLSTRCHEVADEERRQESLQKFLEAGEDARRDNARGTYFEKSMVRSGICIITQTQNSWIGNLSDS